MYACVLSRPGHPRDLASPISAIVVSILQLCFQIGCWARPTASGFRTKYIRKTRRGNNCEAPWRSPHWCIMDRANPRNTRHNPNAERFCALTSGRADFSSGFLRPMIRMSAEQGLLNVLLGGAALHLGKLFGEASIGAQQAANPFQKSIASLFLSGRTRAREVHKMLRRNDLFASCR